MNIKPSLCAPDRVTAFLHETMTSQERAAFEKHLDECEVCREALDAAVATPQDWSELRTSLSGGDDSTQHDADRERADLGFYRKLLGPTDDPRMLGRIGSYEIVGVLGRGGMGIVFKGLDPSLNRYVAIKLLAPNIAACGASRQRFLREAQSAAAVAHEHVVAIHGISQWQDTPYLVMEYVRGESLQKRLYHRGPLRIQELLRIGMQVASGLAAAHAQGLIHRDIKPGNILLETDIDRVRITDFGLARAVDDIRLTRTDMLLGTPQYMSPEQARDEPLDFRSDLFSLGVVLYEAATGRAPFQAATSYGALRKIVDHRPTLVRELNADIPDWFDNIVSRLMAKEPSDRFQSAHEVAELLKQCLAHVEQPQLVPLPESIHPLPVSTRNTHWQKLFTPRRMIVTTSILAVLAFSSWMLFAPGDTVEDSSSASESQSASGGSSASASASGSTSGGKSKSFGETEVGSGFGGVRASSVAENEDEGDRLGAFFTGKVGDYTLSVRKMGEVSNRRMETEFDLSTLDVKEEGQAFGDEKAGGFAGGAGGGFGGSFTKPDFGIAFTVESKKNEGNLIELSPNATAIDDQGRRFEAKSNGPAVIHIPDFEDVARGKYLYFNDWKRDWKSIYRLEGELIVTPGRELVATFKGPRLKKRQVKRVDGETFTLESVKEDDDGISVAVALPPTQAMANAQTPQEKFAALVANRGVYFVELVDSYGEVHRPNSSGSSGASGSSSFSSSDGRHGQQSSMNTSQSFNFSPLPEDRQIQAIRIRMVERTGEPKTVPFVLENIENPVGP